MANTDLLNDLRALLAETFQTPMEQISAELAYGDLPQWDSLGHMDVMMALEEKYGVQISTETISALTSLPVIAAYVEEHAHA